jgi:hypothetical protein
MKLQRYAPGEVSKLIERPFCRHFITVAGALPTLCLLYYATSNQVHPRGYTRSASATVTDVTYEIDKPETEQTTGAHLSLSYEFLVRGETYTGSGSVPDDSPLRVGDRVAISYVGNDPKINTLGVTAIRRKLYFNWICFLAGMWGFIYYFKSYLTKGPMWWRRPDQENRPIAND